MSKSVCTLAVILLSVVVGCDDRSAAPALTDSTPAKPAEVRPTTQQLLSGPFKRLTLAPLPVSAHVPESWTVKMLADNLFFLQGPTPGGEVQIQLAERTSQQADKLERLFRAAKRDAEANKDTTSVEIRQLGDVKVFDVKRNVTHAQPPGDPSATTPSTVPVKYMDWSVTYFIPRGSDFAAYELHFYNLPAELYEADRAFLQRVLDSVTSEQPGLGVTPDTGPR